jgi:hypothetical protein
MIHVCEERLVVVCEESLAGLDSDFFFGLALQNGKQMFFNRILQMTKYFLMRECKNIPTGKSLCCDSAFAHKKEFSIFKFPERFRRSLGEISQFQQLLFLCS